MSQAAVAYEPVSGAPTFRVGRMFVHPAFDYLVIGGVLSVLVGALAYLSGLRFTANDLGTVILLSNSAHFAASTVRLYTKPGASKDWPFLTFAFPVVAVAVLTAVIAVGEPAGRYLFATYLIWSPYHYSAQAFGLSTMYAYRSGVTLDAGERRLVRWTCLVPFFWTLLQPQGGVGLIVPASAYAGLPLVSQGLAAMSAFLSVLALAAPVLMFWRLRARGRPGLPLISGLIVVTNAIWWVLFNFVDAFLLATVFHGLQYLAIVAIFHVKDRERLPGNRRGWLYHTATFYVLCVLLGVVLFHLWPHAYALAGWSLHNSGLLVVATINIHHFVVDRYIWRLRRDANFRNVVDTGAPVPA